MDISVAGFGIGFGGKSDRDSVNRCEEILNMLKKKKLLITIDEVCNDQSMKQFASQFQIWLRKDYEIPYADENIGFFHICVEVDDIQEAWKKVVETGAPQDDAPKQGADYNWQ